MALGQGVQRFEGLLRETITTTVHTRPQLSFPRKLAYGVGHVFNDLCASMWFTYVVLFFSNVAELGNTFAGVVILIGQATDAFANPIIGILCDRTNIRYGRRKLWHLIGTILVAISMFFFWHTCLRCQNSILGVRIAYYTFFVIVFQLGWASVQISHLSLIPDLTTDKNERVDLNAIRHGFTILSNVGVYVAIFSLLFFIKTSPSTEQVSNHSTVYALPTPSHSEEISPADVWVFSGAVLGIVAVGLFFSALFQIGTHEPYITPQQREKLQYARGRRAKWYLWFLEPRFYLVAIIYMCTRLINNIVQAYTPLYLIETLKLSRISVAIGPLVIFLSGLLVTLFLKVLNRVMGRYMVYFIGVAFVWGGLVWFQALDPPGSIGENIAVYGSTALVGAGIATVMVTSLSMVADLIDSATGSAAFVYGLTSFTDKLSSGVLIQIIQALHPCKEQACCPQCGVYYRQVLVLVPGTATVVAVVALAMLSIYTFYTRRTLHKSATALADTFLLLVFQY